MPEDGQRGDRPGASPAGAPAGGPAGPHRPSTPSAVAAPGRGGNRPAPSLVQSPKESTPALRFRHDDIGRAFLYRPGFGPVVPPAPPAGPRSTTHLTARAARQLKGAALKADAVGMGLRTFATFTCQPADRIGIANGELILGREMRRTLNAIQQRFRRETYRGFAYIWVAENPEDENPHVHLVTNHRVPRSEFDEFARWVESLWGHGWVTLERVRKPKQAGCYLLKAVGYSLKGEGGEQGTIRGNRYGISSNIRAREQTADVVGQEKAADVLRLFQASVGDRGVVPCGDVFLTSHGIAFPAGSGPERVHEVIDELSMGGLPG